MMDKAKIKDILNRRQCDIPMTDYKKNDKNLCFLKSICPISFLIYEEYVCCIKKKHCMYKMNKSLLSYM